MLTSAQLATLKTDIQANTNTITINGSPIQIKDVTKSPDNAFAIAAWYSALATPDYWAWRTDVNRAQIYNDTSPAATTWDWTTYKAQAVAEQNAWTQMFMGDVANFGQLNMRVGIGKIFTGSAPATAQRDHCLAVGRRKATRTEKLFGTAVASPPANSGNDGGTRGTTTNPDVLTVVGGVTTDDVQTAMGW